MEWKKLHIVHYRKRFFQHNFSTLSRTKKGDEALKKMNKELDIIFFSAFPLHRLWEQKKMWKRVSEQQGSC